MMYDVKDISKLLNLSEKQTRNIINTHKEELLQNKKRRIELDDSQRGKPKILLNENAVRFIVAKYNKVSVESLKYLAINELIFDVNEYPFTELDDKINDFETKETTLSTDLKAAISKFKFDYSRLLAENKGLKEQIDNMRDNSNVFDEMIKLKNETVEAKNQALLIHQSYLQKIKNADPF